MVASSLACVTYRLLANGTKVRRPLQPQHTATDAAQDRNRDRAVCATDSKISHSVLLELVRVSWPERGGKASHLGVKRTVQIREIFTFSYIFSPYVLVQHTRVVQ